MRASALVGSALMVVAACAFGLPSPAFSSQQAQSRQKPAIPVAHSSAVASSQAASSAPQQTSATPVVAAPALLPMTPVEKEEMRGDIFLARKMFHEAIATYQDLLLQEPKNAKLLNKIGIAYQELGEPKLAERYYKKSAKADKHFASPLNNWGTVEFGQKEYKGAIKQYKRAIKIDPTKGATFSNLGYAYLARKKYKDAIRAFRQAILVDPAIFKNRGADGEVVEQRGNQPPGLFYFLLAKTFAVLGNAASCAHYLKMSREEGYKKYTAALKDPAFKTVLKDPRVQSALRPPAPATPVAPAH